MKVKVGVFSWLHKDRMGWSHTAYTAWFNQPMNHLCWHEVEVERKGLAKAAAIAEHKERCMGKEQS